MKPLSACLRLLLPHDTVEHVDDLAAPVSVRLYGYAFAALQHA